MSGFTPEHSIPSFKSHDINQNFDTKSRELDTEIENKTKQKETVCFANKAIRGVSPRNDLYFKNHVTPRTKFDISDKIDTSQVKEHVEVSIDEPVKLIDDFSLSNKETVLDDDHILETEPMLGDFSLSNKETVTDDNHKLDTEFHLNELHNKNKETVILWPGPIPGL